MSETRPLTHDVYRAYVRESYLRNVPPPSAPAYCLTTIEALSDEFTLQLWESGVKVTDVFHRPAQLGGPISFCFIDGNHSY